MILYLEPRYARLVADIPPYNSINGEMIQFCTEVFGNEGWLQMFQIRQLRKQQEQEEHLYKYMPPVEHIKKLEVDPYTLQVQSDKDSALALSDEEEKEPEVVQQDEFKQTVQKSSWWVRKPESKNQGKLTTGYENIIAQRKGGRHSSQLTIQQEQNDSEEDMNDRLDQS